MTVFTLYSAVFFRCDDDGAVFYNTDTYASVTYKTNPVVVETCRFLGDIDNLNTIPVDEKNKCFCENLRDLGFGLIHEEEEPVVSFPPSLAIRTDWDQVKAINGQANAEVLQYLSEITLYIGGRSDVKDYYCHQTEYPLPGDFQMDYSQLSGFLDKASRAPELRFKFVFPYIDDYPDIKKIVTRIESLKNKYSVFVRDREYYGNREARNILRSVENQVVVLNDSRHLFSDDITDSVKNRFLIFDKAGETASEECVNKRILSKYSFVPIYDGTNEQFIKEATFPTEQELLGGTYTKQHLFAHQVINTFCFGRLSVTPDGKVFSDLREKPIGTLQDSLHALIIAELDNNYSWRQTRYSKSECQQCRYLDLCPSISPLEKIMGMRCVIYKDCFRAQKQ